METGLLSPQVFDGSFCGCPGDLPLAEAGVACEACPLKAENLICDSRLAATGRSISMLGNGKRSSSRGWPNFRLNCQWRPAIVPIWRPGFRDLHLDRGASVETFRTVAVSLVSKQLAATYACWETNRRSTWASSLFSSFGGSLAITAGRRNGPISDPHR